MLSRVLRTIAEQGLFSEGEARGVLMGVSGGPDSMALMSCLWELAPRLNLRLEAACVNHGLRAEAAGEGDLVEARARALGVRCHRLDVDVRGARAQPGAGGTQEVARHLRLGALEALARDRGLGSVALGHQADDQTETVLFRILRGTGIAGLAGIPYWRAPFARPLLDVPRAEILEYLRRRSLPFVSDPSNGDDHFARTRLRGRILPMLRDENPRVDEALRALAASAAEARGAAFGGQAAAPLAASLAALPRRLATRVKEAARRGHGTQRFALRGGRTLVVTYGKARIVASAEAPSAEPSPPFEPFSVSGPGCFPIGAQAFLLVRERLGAVDAPGPRADVGEGRRPPELAWFDGDALAWPLTVRRRRAGDRVQPRPGPGTRKLADSMIDAKIPRFERDRLPVVVDRGGEVLYVPGVRPSARAAPALGTARFIGFGMLKLIEDVG